MELICRIVEQHPLQTRQYTDRNGQPQTITSMGFTLQSGPASFYAELTGEQAVRQAQLSKDFYYHVQMNAKANSWQDQQGQTRRGTNLYINNICVL